MKNFDLDLAFDETKEIAAEVVALLKTKKLTISGVREVLSFIDQTIEDNVVLE